MGIDIHLLAKTMPCSHWPDNAAISSCWCDFLYLEWTKRVDWQKTFCEFHTSWQHYCNKLHNCFHLQLNKYIFIIPSYMYNKFYLHGIWENKYKINIYISYHGTLFTCGLQPIVSVPHVHAFHVQILQISLLCHLTTVYASSSQQSPCIHHLFKE